MVEAIQPVLQCLEYGLSRAAMVRFDAAFGNSFDTHAENWRQSDYHEFLFDALLDLFADMEARPGAAGGTLADEVVLVVFSEMGRTPQFNDKAGKDHWTFTSSMLVGPGVRGGAVVGGYDDVGFGVSTDPASGEPSDHGVFLEAGHLGATLLALGDVDPGEYLPGVAPLTAALES